MSGTQAFYDWHEVSHTIPGYDYRAAIPDGQLAGAGHEKYAGLNLARTDWFATPMTAGARACRFYATTPHEPSFFRTFITRPGYDPRQALRWDDLVEIFGGETAELRGSCGKASADCHCGTTGAGLSYYMTLEIPERVGRHVLFVVWQRVDPAAEVFFSTSDLDFGGVDYGDGGDGSARAAACVEPERGPSIPAAGRLRASCGRGGGGSPKRGGPLRPREDGDRHGGAGGHDDPGGPHPRGVRDHDEVRDARCQQQ